MEHLGNILSQAGKAPLPLVFPDGSRLLLLPGSGRVLGLYAPGAGENFLWTNPALAAADSAKAYFARDGWPNPGGDRTWLAPEIEFFIGDLTRVQESYRVPPELDPGTWRMGTGGQGLSLSQEAVLPLRQSGGTIQLRLGKSYTPAPNPLRETKYAGAPLQFAGYTQRTTLELLSLDGSGKNVQAGLWNLLQLPQPGEMLIPTWFAARPQVVFGAISPAELKAGPRLVRWSMTGVGGDTKIALKSMPLTGRAGHLCRSPGSETWNLVVRQFTVNPSGEYVDALWQDPADRGYVFQACCVCSGQERFNELEYHVPAVGREAGRNRCADESRVWAFRGSAKAIADAARFLLGARISR